MGGASSGLSGLESAGNSGGGGGYYYGGYSSGYPGSWYTSAYLKGMADVVRSAGYASLMNGQAAQSYEKAFSTDLDNRLKATNNYFAVKRMNLSLQSQSRGTPSTPAELVHQAHEMAPKRLSTTQLDPFTGEVAWPTVLKDDRYEKLRESVEQRFGDSQANGGSGADYRDMIGAIDALRTAMAKNIADYNPSAYVEARKFLDSLAYEARLITN